MDVRRPPEEIKTEHLYLRKHSPALAAEMFATIDRDRARLGQHLPFPALTLAETDSKNYIAGCIQNWKDGKTFDYGIFVRETGRYIGNVGVHNIRWENDTCELGYWIDGEFEGKGFMSEAAGTLAGELFELGFNRVEIHCDPKNARSAKVPERLGFILEGRIRQNTKQNEERRDTRIYGMLRTEAGFEPLPSK